jgi:PAS domain S-box-containing protein
VAEPRRSLDDVAEELKASPRFYRNLVEHSLGLICAHDLEGNLLFVNSAALQSLGYELQNVLGLNLSQFLAPSTRDRFSAYLARICQSGIDAGLMRLVGNDGRERIWMYRNILYNEPPDPPHVIGHAVDVTDRIQIEGELRENRDALARTLTELDERVQERTSELQRANALLQAEIAERERAEEMRRRVIAREREHLAFWTTVSKQLAAGLEYESTLQKVARMPVPFLADWSLLHIVLEQGDCRCVAGAHVDRECQPALERLAATLPTVFPDSSYVARALNTGQLKTVTFGARTLTEDWLGSNEHVDAIHALGAEAVMIVPLTSGDHVLGALSLVWIAPSRRFAEADTAMLDVLARRFAAAIDRARLYQQAQAANRLKDEFLATLSHELRTPLQAVIGWARVLRIGHLDAKAGHAAEVIERNAFALARMVEDILDVSRIITGKLSLQQRSVDLPVVLGAALDSIKPAARAKGITLGCHIENTPAITGDEHRLQQVMWNLLSNAVKFTPEGGTINVSLQQMGRTVKLVVSDTGVGIRREVLPFVFDRFRQGDASSTRRQGGLGLGLAIVRHIVELHGGSVAAQSVEGEGATFVVEIPVAASLTEPQTMPTTPAAPDTRRPQVSGEGLGGARVLIVDDDADARELVAHTIGRAGGVTRTAASVREAIGALTTFEPEVVIADIALPHEDGYDLIRGIRESTGGRSSPLPVIALTGYTRSEDRSRALAAGFEAYLGKPVEPDALIAVIRGALDS